jgi:hypothetical protein
MCCRFFVWLRWWPGPHIWKAGEGRVSASPEQFIGIPSWCAFGFTIASVAGLVGAAAGIGGAFFYLSGALAAFPTWKIAVAQGAHVGDFLAVPVHCYFLSFPARRPDHYAEAFGLLSGV